MCRGLAPGWGQVADASRIRASIPTVVFLAAAGARVVLLSHLGRPKGPDVNFSLAPVSTVVRSLCLSLYYILYIMYYILCAPIQSH